MSNEKWKMIGLLEPLMGSETIAVED